jgi:serine/threonine-protein kinase
LRISGTHSYLAPETISREGFDIRADVYSTGIMIYELLCGHHPFPAENEKDLLRLHLYKKVRPPREENPKITREAEELVMKMLEKRPDHRPPNMSYIADRLRQIKLWT